MGSRDAPKPCWPTTCVDERDEDSRVDKGQKKDAAQARGTWLNPDQKWGYPINISGFQGHFWLGRATIEALHPYPHTPSPSLPLSPSTAHPSLSLPYKQPPSKAQHRLTDHDNIKHHFSPEYSRIISTGAGVDATRWPVINILREVSRPDIVITSISGIPSLASLSLASIRSSRILPPPIAGLASLASSSLNPEIGKVQANIPHHGTVT